MSIQIRLATKADAIACNDLHNKAYGNSRTLEQWSWTFGNGLFSDLELPFVVAEDEGIIVGTQALIPIQMIDEDGVYWSAKSEETLVASDYRGQGLFEKMYDKVFEVARASDFQSIWGFTPARKSFQRVGFNIPGDTSQLFKPLKPKCVITLIDNAGTNTEQVGLNGLFWKTLYLMAGVTASLYSGVREWFTRRFKSELEMVELHDLTSAPQQGGQLSEDFITHWGGTTIYRDQKYLKWRIFDNPYCKPNMVGAYVEGELIGYCGFSLGENQMGHIVDIFVTVPKSRDIAPGDVVYKLLASATNRMSDMGACGIRGWSMTTHKFDQLVAQEAKKLGYIFFDRGTAVVLNNSYETNCHRNTDEFECWSVTRIYTEGRTG
jgi:GNAT superfamily N-acetyltransferase